MKSSVTPFVRILITVFISLNLFSPLAVSAQNFNGRYHSVNSKNLTPIEKLMKESNYCEISDPYILIPNCATEFNEDGSIPVDEIRIEKLYPLFNGDVMEYFSRLKKEHNTPLKVKRYKESDEYKSDAYEIRQEANCILGSTFYAIREISSDEYFDIEDQTFTFRMPDALIGYDIYLSRNDGHFNSDYFVTTHIDEDTAYKIETNPCNIIVFIKFTGETRIHGISHQSVCDPVKIVIANCKSGDIYYEYSPTKDIPNLKTNKIITTQPSELQQIGKTYNIAAVEQAPEFPGGTQAMYKWLSQNIVFPTQAAEEGVQGKVMVEFTVTKTGTIENVKVMRSRHPALDKEAVRVVRTMPRWYPGRINGQPVNVIYTVPVTFKLQQ